MESIKGFVINAPAEQVREILYTRFDEIYIWSSDVENSVPDPEVPIGQGRYCEIDGFGILKDTIWHANSSKMMFTFLRSGFSFHIKDIKTVWLIKPNGSRQCQITNDVRIHFNRTSGFIFYRPLASRLERLRVQMIEDLCYFAERGKTREVTKKSN